MIIRIILKFVLLYEIKFKKHFISNLYKMLTKHLLKHCEFLLSEKKEQQIYFPESEDNNLISNYKFTNNNSLLIISPSVTQN